jgi:hypothetical protein
MVLENTVWNGKDMEEVKRRHDHVIAPALTIVAHEETQMRVRRPAQEMNES